MDFFKICAKIITTKYVFSIKKFIFKKYSEFSLILKVEDINFSKRKFLIYDSYKTTNFDGNEKKADLHEPK